MVKIYSMNDVGRRIDFLMDLHELWSTGLAIVTSINVPHNAMEVERAKELEHALRLLSYHLQNDYDQTPYAVEINELPKHAQDIPDDKIGGKNNAGGESNYNCS